MESKSWKNEHETRIKVDKVIKGTEDELALNEERGDNFILSIVSAVCPYCNANAEQLEHFPPIMHYQFCLFCGQKIEE